MTHQQAIRQLFTYAGIQFDPRIVQVFARLPRSKAAGPILLESRGRLAQLESAAAG
jgi:HD-GYP domain-containing protein (c-di-GMP phosphodiesterase class II)